MESAARESTARESTARESAAREPPQPPAPRPGFAARLAGKGPYLLISLGVLALDQWTKWLVEMHVPLSSVRPVFPGLNITHVKNTGVAFGMFASDGGAPWPLAVLVVAALAAVAAYFVVAPREHRLLLTSLGLILGGALGNLVDRLHSGGVTDFIDVYAGTYHWYFFNVADAAISVGIVLMAFEALRPHPGPAADAARPAAE